MGNVTTVFASDDKDVQRAFASMQKEMVRLKEANRQLAEQTKQGAKESQSFFDGGVAGLAKMAAGYLTLETAISKVTEKLVAQAAQEEKLKQLAVDATEQRAKALAGFTRNAGFIDSKELQSLKSQVVDISRETGVSTDVLFPAAGAALSAKGSLTNKQAMAALRQAALATPEGDAATVEQLTGGLLDIAKLSGSGDARRNFGLLAGVAANARVTDIGKIAKNAVPGATAVRQQGGTAAEALAIVATMTSLLDDQEGAVSRTAAVKLSEELAKQLPKLASPVERIRAMQADPALRKKFLAGWTETTTLGGVRQLLEGGRAAELLNQNIAAIPNEDAVAKGDQLIANLQQQREVAIARTKGRLAAGAEEMAVGDVSRAWQGAIEPKLKDILRQTGMDPGKLEWVAGGKGKVFDSDFVNLVESGMDPRAAAYRLLLGRRVQLTHGNQSGAGSLAVASREEMGAEDNLPAKTVRILQSIDKHLEVLRQEGAAPVINPEAHGEGR